MKYNVITAMCWLWLWSLPKCLLHQAFMLSQSFLFIIVRCSVRFQQSELFFSNCSLSFLQALWLWISVATGREPKQMFLQDIPPYIKHIILDLYVSRWTFENPVNYFGLRGRCFQSREANTAHPEKHSPIWRNSSSQMFHCQRSLDEKGVL